MANNNAPPQLPQQIPLLSLLRGMFTGEKKHPSHGGNLYFDDFRQDVVMWYQLGLLLDTEELNSLCAVDAYPSLSSCAWYIKKHNALGHCRAMLKTDNKEAERMVRGQLLVYLALFVQSIPLL
jgi:hypothetical protein